MVAAFTAATRQRGAIPDGCAGFHGDAYLLRLVAHLMKSAKAFIETGTNLGTTARYVAIEYPQAPVYTCEADAEVAADAAANLAPYPQAHSFHESSPQFLHRIHEAYPQLKEQLNLYWLDAHGYGFTWPLRDEVHYLTRTLKQAFIFIDDFQVPHRPDFGFDCYLDQICSLPYILPGLNPQCGYTLLYPTYTSRTSRHHPLRGTGLLLHGIENFALPLEIGNDFAAVRIPAR